MANSVNDWADEVALDTQWAHAMAPAANIILVTAKSASLADLMAAVQTAAQQPGVVAISMSWGGNEASIDATYDGVLQSIQAQGIVLLASSGDAGDNNGGNGTNSGWPSVSPYVTSVGGTTIKTVGYAPPTVATEVAWSLGGGGTSLLEAIPAWQKTALTGTTALSLDTGANSQTVMLGTMKFFVDMTKRLVPDVSYNADWSNSMVGVVMAGRWYGAGGTSAGAPQWAAIIAGLAQTRVVKKETSLSTVLKATAGGFNGLLYQAKLDTTSFFDVTTGTDNVSSKACALCTAGKGYDAATGLGVPNVTNLQTFF